MVEPQVLSLNQLVESMADLLTRIAGETISIQFELEESLWNVLLDPTQAQQVVLNLVLNARDAMANGGKIVVTTKNYLPERSGSGMNRRTVSLAVSDCGCGMDEQTQGRLFQPFFTTKSQGNGLGLATVHRIVQDAGGTISVESSEGKGTRIEIVLPGVLEEIVGAKERLELAHAANQGSCGDAGAFFTARGPERELTQVTIAKEPIQRKNKVL